MEGLLGQNMAELLEEISGSVEWARLFGEFQRNPLVSGESKNKITNCHIEPRAAAEIQELLQSAGPSLETNEPINSSDFYGYIKNPEFKSKFMSIVEGNIENNLDEALLMNSELERNHFLDEKLQLQWEKTKTSPEFENLLNFRKKLPIYEKKAEILKLIENNQICIISGETGCGKTTQVSQYLLDQAIENSDGSVTHIICTQPRRISAVSVAERVALERTEKLGESVGYQIRLEKVPAREQGSIMFCTTGMLLQYMQRDPSLKKYSHIILDEIHERTIHIDFIMALLKKVVPKRPDLKVILMSATFNSQKFSEYYNFCPKLHVPGFTYPVDEFYLDDVIAALMNFNSPLNPKFATQGGKSSHKAYLARLGQSNPEHVLERAKKQDGLLPNLIDDLIHYICTKKDPGAILIFLPGFGDIQSTMRRLKKNRARYPRDKFQIYQLHSRMPTDEQKMVFEAPPNGVRKIIVSTNIAEISVTIDDVVYIIDCGKQKVDKFDIQKNLVTLNEEWVTMANAKQRKGRAGRVQPGVCYRLYTKERENQFEQYPMPEIQRSRLEEIILTLKLLQLGKASTFLTSVLDPPNSQAVHLSIELLQRLNALDKKETLTPLGYHLAQLPLDPRTGKMIIWAALFSCVDPILSIAASLSFKTPFFKPVDEEESQKAKEKKIELSMGQHSDHVALALAVRRYEDALQESKIDIDEFCKEYFLAKHTLKMIVKMKEQFASHLYDIQFLNSKNFWEQSENENSANLTLVKAVVCAGLFPNVAFIKGYNLKGKAEVMTPEDGSVNIDQNTVNGMQNKSLPHQYLTYFDKQEMRSSASTTPGRQNRIYLYDTSCVSKYALLLASALTANEGPQGSITVFPGINFSFGNEKTLIETLMEKLNDLVKYKINNPGSLEEYPGEKNILKAMIVLIVSGK